MKMRRKVILLMLTAAAVTGIGFAAAEPAAGISCGAWAVYWDADSGLEEAGAMNPAPDRLIAFEALFGTDRKVMMESQAEELLLKMQSLFPSDRIWLSVVNDLSLEQGGYSNKNRQLVRDLTGTPEQRKNHVRELVALAEEWQLKGLEIDYENIHEDVIIWQGFIAFVQELYEELRERGIALRVCLEWDSRLYTELPEGPEYSIMCYSLFGYHSGPGPKADSGFLKKAAELYRDRKDCAMALATGGYDWNGNSVERELTEKQAERIFRSRNIKPVRDADSGVLYGSYLQDGQTHTVWYADAETLRGWMETLRGYGFSKFDFFRLGGNTVEDWNERILYLQGRKSGKEDTEP